MNQRRAAALLQAAGTQFGAGDAPRALRTLHEAARLGHEEAQYHLGMALLAGDPGHRDVDQGLAWMRRAAVAGHVAAMQALGQIHVEGALVPQDAAYAVAWFERAAARGDATSRYMLGLQYLEGVVTPADERLAFKWIRAAAEQRHPDACTTLGLLYEGGRGVTLDLTQALAWQVRAAQLGSTRGQCNAGRHYLLGIGTPVDAAVAVSWFSQAAQAGDADAQFSLGLCCLRGDGVKKDPDEAARWFSAAAAQGHSKSKVVWACMLSDGTTGPPDLGLSFKLLDEAEAAGEDVAEMRLLVMKSHVQASRDTFAKLQESFASNGAQAPPAPDDDNAEDPDDLDALLEGPTPFRRTCCFFAFHLLPQWLFEAHRPGQAVDTARILAQMPDLWAQAVRLDQASGVYVSTPEAEPTCRDVPPWTVVELPIHSLAPEPSVVLIDLSVFPARVMLVERFLSRDERGLLCSIDEQMAHAVHGTLPDQSVATAVAMVSPRLPPHGLPSIDAWQLMHHLALYVEVQDDIERGRAQA